MVPSILERTKVFVIYSREDSVYLKGLLLHLKSIKTEKDEPIDIWTDARIRPGDQWQDEITLALASTKVAILLISADFLTSQFIIDSELPTLLNAAKAEGVKILPVIIRPCKLPANLSQFQMINSPSKPVSGMSETEKEELWVKVAEATIEAMTLPQLIYTTNFPEEDSSQPELNPSASTLVPKNTEQSPEETLPIYQAPIGDEEPVPSPLPSNVSKLQFIKQYKRNFSIGFIVIFLAILIGGGIYFMNHHTSILPKPTISMPIYPEPTIPQQQQLFATQILKSFCTYLENGKYSDINGLIRPKTIADNKGYAKVLQGWRDTKVETCQPGTVQREANTNVFLGTLIYSRIDSPTTKYAYQITIDNSDGPWKITDWGSADRTDPQKTIGIYCSVLQTNNPDILHSLIPQARWQKVQIAFFSDCTPDSDAGVSCSSNRQILYIFGGGRKRSILLQLINEQWFIVDYEDLSSANHSNCQDDNNLPKIGMVSYDQKTQG